MNLLQRFFSKPQAPALEVSPASRVTPLGYLPIDWQSHYRWVNLSADPQEGVKRARVREYHLKGKAW